MHKQQREAEERHDKKLFSVNDRTVKTFDDKKILEELIEDKK